MMRTPTASPTDESHTDEEWHAAFVLHLEKARYADTSQCEALVRYAEEDLADAIRRYVRPHFGSLYSESSPKFYYDLRTQMNTPGNPLFDANRQTNGQLSLATKHFINLLNSKYNPLQPSKARLSPNERLEKASATTDITGITELDEVATYVTEPMGTTGEMAEEMADAPITLLNGMEGAEREEVYQRYERDRNLREACIAHFGATCQACGFNFGRVYGDLGEGFIEVHHLRPIATWQGEEHNVDPTTDLVPLCANCHRMIHRMIRHTTHCTTHHTTHYDDERVLTLDELRAIIHENKCENDNSNESE